MPVARGPFGVQYASLPVHIDEGLLTRIADLTGGRYCRAQSREALQDIYSQIVNLEKTRVNVRRYMDYTPWHLPFVLAAAAFLLAEWLLRASRWGRDAATGDRRPRACREAVRFVRSSRCLRGQMALKATVYHFVVNVASLESA